MSKASAKLFFFTINHLPSDKVCSHFKVPPLEVKHFSADIGATVHLSQPFVVGGEVVNKCAFKSQSLHQGTHLCLQNALSVNFWTKGLRNAEVFPQDNHVDLRTRMTDHHFNIHSPADE